MRTKWHLVRVWLGGSREFMLSMPTSATREAIERAAIVRSQFDGTNGRVIWFDDNTAVYALSNYDALLIVRA